LLQQGREEALAELAVAERRALRPLVGRLWDPDDAIRGRAARAVGLAASASPDLGLEIIRRLMWALNDESATNGVHVIPALGEIGRQAPGLLEPFVAPLVSMTGDDGLRIELLRAFTAIAGAAPHLVARHLERLEAAIDATKPEERQALAGLVAAAGRESDHDA